MALNCDFEGIDNELLVRRGNNSSLRVRRCDLPLQVDTGNNVVANKSNLSNFSRYSIQETPRRVSQSRQKERRRSNHSQINDRERSVRTPDSKSRTKPSNQSGQVMCKFIKGQKVSSMQNDSLYQQDNASINNNGTALLKEFSDQPDGLMLDTAEFDLGKRQADGTYSMRGAGNFSVQNQKPSLAKIGKLFAEIQTKKSTQ